MRIRVGCEFTYASAGPTPTVWQIRPRPEGPHRLESETFEVSPDVAVSSYLDTFGNLCDRLTLPAGPSKVVFDAMLEAPEGADDADEEAVQLPIEDLPDDTMMYLLPSRFCLSDLLYDQAWDLFGTVAPGYARAQAVSGWVHEHVRWTADASTATTTAADVLRTGSGVCRDFAHLGITFLRALNMPARYVFGYLPDIGVPDPGAPMDFCAWLEVYLGGRWFTFDPRNNMRRTGRIVIGRGRDALDVAMVTSYGGAVLEALTVWADEA